MESPAFDVIVKEPLVRGPLALYPLFSLAPAAPAYLTGPEAERLGVLRVGEVPGGATVPELTVHNTGARPLLLVEGETLVGAKQNRTLDQSVLVPAGGVAAIPVSCVEAGRWGAPRASARSVRHAPADLRRVKTSTLANPRRAAMKQSMVWDRVARYQDDLQAASPTSALEDVVESRATDVASLVADARPAPEQCGVAVAIGGTLRGFDCFDAPTTLAAYWDALVAGYALDALGATEPAAPAVDAVEALVAATVGAARTPTPTTGLGTTATFAGDGVVGTQLVWEGAYVHISAFVDETGTPSSNPDGSTVRPIRRRPPRSPR